MIIAKKFEMKITGAWQSYIISESLTVDTSSSKDLEELSSIVGDLKKFGSTRDAVSYACQVLVFNELNHLISNDHDFGIVWTARAAELATSQAKNMSINNSIIP